MCETKTAHNLEKEQKSEKDRLDWECCLELLFCFNIRVADSEKMHRFLSVMAAICLGLNSKQGLLSIKHVHSSSPANPGVYCKQSLFISPVDCSIQQKLQARVPKFGQYFTKFYVTCSTGQSVPLKQALELSSRILEKRQCFKI